jgi:hypothetical protein
MDRIDPAYDSEISYFSDPDCSEVIAAESYTAPSGSCINNFAAVVSSRVYCSRVALGNVGLRFYGNVGCNMPTLEPNSSQNNFATANAVSIFEDTCVGVDAPWGLDGTRTIYVRAQCNFRQAATPPETDTNFSTTASDVATPAPTTERDLDDADAEEARAADLTRWSSSSPPWPFAFGSC